MNIQDIIKNNMLINSLPKIDTGYILIDTIYILAMIIIFGYVSNLNFKLTFFDNILNFDRTKKLVYSSCGKTTSKRFRAIMFYISKNNDISIKKLTEIIDIKYSYKSESYEETKQTCYRVDQYNQFLIDKDIYGRILNKEKEVLSDSGKVKIEEIIYLEVFSYKLSLNNIQEWVESKLKDFENHIKSKILDKQLLVDISWNNLNKDVNVQYHNWESNVTFDNRFFTNKEKILDKVNFFINNPEWYKERGIPWTLGILLWGKPGCGKTGFIKALMNHTKRNAITVKLNNKFNLAKLKKIIYNDEINDELVIPIKDRILIFEDIDCMSNIVIDRDLKNNEKQVMEEAIKIKYKDLPDKSVLDKIDIDDCNDNNLSYFLNIIDGLQECPGRIIIMTTNKPEVLDAALVRSGRIDYKIEFTLATLKDVQDIISFYWNDKNIDSLDSNVNLKFSHADVVNFCRLSNSLNETIDKLNS